MPNRCNRVHGAICFKNHATNNLDQFSNYAGVLKYNLLSNNNL